MDNRIRCSWCNRNNPIYIAYHDLEWCQPNFDDQYLYEMLILESFQAGLSWQCVLNKRESFRQAYDGFDLEKVCAYGDEKIEELLENEKIIRNVSKIRSSIQNSRIFRAILKEYGSFFNYLRAFAGEKIIYETGKTTNALSDAISGNLQKRGMKYVGSTIIYSYLQAIGMIYSHEEACFLYKGGGLRERK
jgi:DNA-3-methyladenine glycosylase I